MVSGHHSHLFQWCPSCSNTLLWFIVLSTLVSIIQLTFLIEIISAAILYPLVDVKGNGAIRQIRLLYDIYETPQTASIVAHQQQPSSVVHHQSSNIPIVNSSASRLISRHLDKRYWPLYPWSSYGSTRTFLDGRNLSDGRKYLDRNWSLESSGTDHKYYYYPYGKRHPLLSNQKLKLIDLQLQRKQPQPVLHYLIRGRPMFAEIDFIPRYIPQWTSHLAVSVTLPTNIRGRPWLLGYHQEEFPMPACRLCTNLEQSYTVPVTLFLPDDGWCAEGPVQTIWKIEAIQQQTSSSSKTANIITDGPQMGQGFQTKWSNQHRILDQTDMIMAYGYDDLKQLYIKNLDDAQTKSTSFNGSSIVNRCKNIKEAIIDA